MLLSHCNRTNDHHNYCGSSSCAPDDYNVVCRTNPRFAQEHILPDEWELMLDSRDYLTLVEDAIPVWVKRDVDGDGKQVFLQLCIMFIYIYCIHARVLAEST